MAKNKKEFPYRKSDDKALEDGQQVARARYHREVDAAARSLLEDISVPRGSSRDDVDEAIRQRIDEDSDSAVTYTRDALEIVMLSDSWTAVDDAEEEGIFEWSSVGSTSDAITKIAYFAYHKDLTAQVEAHKSDYFGEPED